jgi:hypothetical protein
VDALLTDDRGALAASLTHTAREALRVCAVSAEERIVILGDDATAGELLAVFAEALADLGHVSDPLLLTLHPRQPAFADLPPHAVDALLAADFALDLTTSSWLYSDSFTRFARECEAAGTRLALVWGSPESLRTVAACPPSARLAERCSRGLEALNRARTLHVHSDFGTDFRAELGDPDEYRRAFIGEPPTRSGMIGAPLYASVTAPFVRGTARGTLAFVGAGRFQGPENLPLRSDTPVRLAIDEGRLVRAGRS